MLVTRHDENHREFLCLGKTVMTDHQKLIERVTKYHYPLSFTSFVNKITIARCFQEGDHCLQRVDEWRS